MMKNLFLADDAFYERHIGSNEEEIAEMLEQIGAESLDELMDQTIPPSIRRQTAIDVGEAMTEHAYLNHIRQLAAENEWWRSYIGLGYYGTITPPVIQRNILENPSWYTQYTPYQAEIAQGRLEALLNFQTMVSDLTGLEIANASLLDEGTAAAESMQMFYRIRNKRNRKAPINKFLVAKDCLPHTIEVLKTRAVPMGLELVIQDWRDFEFDETVFGCLLQYPAQDGAVYDYETISEKAHELGAYVTVAADLLSLALLKEPGAWGADAVVGNTQRFGVPMGYGGPHAAYFATKTAFTRQIPGRIIGVSTDVEGKNAYRMALQTREQHIRRDRATSNICTAQALLAIMAGMYAVYHGQKGIKRIANNIHYLTLVLAERLEALGYQQKNKVFFDTLLLDLSEHTATSALRVRRVAEMVEQVNLRYFEDNEDWIGISLDETCTMEDVNRICQVFAEAADLDDIDTIKEVSSVIPKNLQRTSHFLAHPVFEKYHTETKLMRYIKQLERRDLSLTHSMIPLGSCTMKLNAAAELMPISFPAFNQLHPFIPVDQAKGYQKIFQRLEEDLAQITGFAACSLQPNSGAQGEYCGLMVIRAYHLDRGEKQRNIALIPESAHGTNPASAVMAGMKVVVVKCDESGNIDVKDLRDKAAKYQNELSALMITYPSTHGVFEEAIQEICQYIHDYGGQVYMDGANMNAQVGLTNPHIIGADVCHLNLHKTFSIPHGGGGPGMGPICVATHLAPYLPNHIFKKEQTSKGISAVSSAAWGSASILLISYAYIKLLGSKGITNATKMAILNANYIKERLGNAYEVLYVGAKGRVGHELILDTRKFKRLANIEVTDIAKRLIDYGFHAPTVSFPVAGTMMIEPTESESKEEIDRFCEAMLSIRKEIEAIELGMVSEENNLLVNAPHTIAAISAEEWERSYTRQMAAFPLAYLTENKFWPAVARVDNSKGDRNLICTCPPIADYVTQ